MIILRYLARNLLSNTLGVAAVLMLVVVSARFVKYLAAAASGKYDAAVLLALMAFRLPGFFEVVLPLAFFLSILLAYGQLHVDSEMTVLQACGMSDKKLIAYTMTVALLVAVLVAAFSLYISPAGYSRMEQLVENQKQRGEVETLTAGKFYPLRANKGVTYAEEITDEGVLENVFLAQTGDQYDDNGLVIIVAKHGFSRKSEETGESYLVLKDGQRIQGIPGRADFQLTRFAEFGQRLDAVDFGGGSDIEATPTRALVASSDPLHKAMLQWRLSLPVMVLVVTMLAVPLSKTNPRQGRFAKILPAVVLYVIYLLALNGARGAVEDAASYSKFAMAGVHLLFFALALVLLAANSGRWRFRPAKAVVAQ
ncbi:MAG: LPS export ABC transporter permease LptF [Porticoccaceae bacterium]|nr:LPS export ABC transporter permease LptF [Porticoccaceae bacterium]